MSTSLQPAYQQYLISPTLPAQALSKRISDYEPTFTDVTNDAYNLIRDPQISSEDKIRLQTEVQDCEDRWDTLNDNMKLHVDG